MRTYHALLFALCGMLAACSKPAETKVQDTFTGSQLLDKCIAYHDPNNAWPEYAGKVRLVYVTPTLIYDEVIEFNRKNGFYQSTMSNPDGKVIKGLRNNVAFRIIRGDSTLTGQQIEEAGLTDETIQIYVQHHASHFALPMKIKESGAAISDTVDAKVFNGVSCYVLKIVGNPGKTIHPYFEGTRKLFIDKENFSVRGLELRNEATKADFYQFYAGELNVNGILVPQVKTAFRKDNNAYVGTDVFTPISVE